MADRPDSLTDNSNSSANARRPIAFAAILVAIVAVELAFVGWFITVPLPNAGNAGVVKNQRIYLLITSLPEIVPGVHWDESHLGLAIKELGRCEYLPQRLPIVLAAALIAGAAIVYVSTPWIYRLAAIPYVEGPLCYFHAALIWGIVRAWIEPDRSRTARLWGLVGGFAGGAFTCKYPGLISAIAPASLAASLAAVSKRNGKIVAYFVAGAAVAVGPWLLKNAIDTGNPVYPLGYRVFGGRFWDDELDAKWSRAHGRRPISARALVDSAVEVAGKNDWQSPLFAMLAPLALLRVGSRKAAIVLLSYVIYIFLTWWILTHRLDRVWLPVAVPSASLAGIGADWVKARAWSVVLAGIVFFGVFSNFVFDSTKLAAFNQWTGDLDALDVRVPAELHSLPLSLLDASLPQGAKVLVVGQAGVFHVEHAIVYDTVFNRQTFETLAEGRSAAEIHHDLRQQKITHIYVDWPEIRRYRSPGNYGFPAFVVPAVFDRLVRDGVLEPAPLASAEGVEGVRKAGVTSPETGAFKFEQKLYKVR
ncbi:MAG: hypothetical protein NVSMB14_04850 [Isosphaeraceae bacterium]